LHCAEKNKRKANPFYPVRSYQFEEASTGPGGCPGRFARIFVIISLQLRKVRLDFQQNRLKIEIFLTSFEPGILLNQLLLAISRKADGQLGLVARPLSAQYQTPPIFCVTDI
jgi:hypothetical protein